MHRIHEVQSNVKFHGKQSDHNRRCSVPTTWPYSFKAVDESDVLINNLILNLINDQLTSHIVHNRRCSLPNIT